MMVLFIVLPLALIVAGLALWAFIWTVRSGQMDDLDTPPIRMLFDDDPPASSGPSPGADDEPEEAELDSS